MDVYKLKNGILSFSAILIIAMASITGCETPITYPPGGYDYPAKDSVSDTDFYFYPLKANFPHKELFGVSRHYLFYKAFDEPNLSIKPMGGDIFRFLHYGFKSLPLFITITKNEMVIKKGTKYNMSETVIDTNRLTKIEKAQYHLLERYFPLTANTYSKKSRTGRLVDSMVTLYPELLRNDYYKYLFSKAIAPKINYSNYNVEKIRLSKSEFTRLISVINTSGYWKMPHEIECNAPVLDGNGFSLEANTSKKYNYVGFGSCGEKTDMQKAFVEACRKIVNQANLSEKIYF